MSPAQSIAVISWLPNWLSLVIGIAIVLGTASSVMRSLVVTRGMRSILATTVDRIIRAVIIIIARRFKNYETRDGIQSWMAPLFLVGILLIWLLCFLIGYTFLLNGSNDFDFWTSMREAGSSLFTLGFASSDRTQLTIVDFIAAATGPIVIGLMISYLPTLYSAYSRREVTVALLKPIGGEPSWGPEILARDTLVGVGRHKLTDIWADWERWGADVSESHSTYTVLIFTRSARANRNWLVSLLAVMDSAAMTLALNPSEQQAPARMLLRQGVECVYSVADALGLKFDRNPDPDNESDLQADEFGQAVAMLDSLGYHRERSAEDAWPYFQQWRVMYEDPMYQILKIIDAVPAKWSGPRVPHTPEIPPLRQRYIINNPDGSISPMSAVNRIFKRG